MAELVAEFEDEGFVIEEPPKIFLRRQMIFVVKDDNGGEVKLKVSGLSPQDVAFKDGQNMSAAFNDTWESMKKMHSEFFSGKPINDYEWGGMSHDDDD